MWYVWNKHDSCDRLVEFNSTQTRNLPAWAARNDPKAASSSTRANLLCWNHFELSHLQVVVVAQHAQCIYIGSKNINHTSWMGPKILPNKSNNYNLPLLFLLLDACASYLTRWVSPNLSALAHGPSGIALVVASSHVGLLQKYRHVVRHKHQNTTHSFCT